MRRRVIDLFAAFLLAATFCGSAVAATGPVQTPLKISHIYVVNGGGAVYVAFQSGSMPGCYGNAGGYLFPSNPFYKEIHALVLMMVATGGVRASVLYTQNAVTNNWGDCTIDGIWLTPE